MVRSTVVPLAVCVLVAVPTASAVKGAGRQAASAPVGEVIEWSKDARLSKDSFKATAPAVAVATAHGWVGLEVEWECREDKPISHARAVFDPAQSWWRSAAEGNLWGTVDVDSMSRSQLENRRTLAEREADLLRHEQLHFDLTELAARKIRQQLDGLQKACETPGATADIEQAINDIEHGWMDEQAAYDKQTGHGTNLVRQRQWELRVRRALQ